MPRLALAMVVVAAVERPQQVAAEKAATAQSLEAVVVVAAAAPQQSQHQTFQAVEMEQAGACASGQSASSRRSRSIK